MRLGLREQLLGGAAAVTVTAMLLLAWLILRGAEREILLEARRSIRAEVADLARDVAAADPRETVRALGAVAHRYAGGGRLLGVEIYDARGARIAAARRGGAEPVSQGLVREAAAAGEAMRAGGTGWWKGERPTIVAQRVGEGDATRVVAATVDLGETYARIERMRLATIVFAALAALIALVGGREILRRRVLGPIESLGRATARVAAGDYALRVDARRTDEIGALERSFNEMAAALAAGRARTDAQIEELEHLNETLRASQREVVRAEKLATVGSLAAGVAHEIGNPLGAIRGNVELLDLGGLDDADRERIHAGMARAAERIDRIVRALLDFARPTKPSRERVDPRDAVARALELVRVQRACQGVAFSVECAEEIPVLETDPALVEQILVNLLLNAAQAIDGEGRVRVLLGAAVHAAEADKGPRRRRGDEGSPLSSGARVLRIDVIDSGPGVPAPMREAIFDPFVTTKGPGEGTGLGLAVSRRLARELGGDLALVDAEGPGATFRLTLPLVETSA